MLWQPRNMSIHTGICNTTHDSSNRAKTAANDKIMCVIAGPDGNGVYHKTMVKPKAKSKTTKLQLDAVPGVWTVVNNSLVNRHAHLDHKAWATAHTPNIRNIPLKQSLAHDTFRNAWLMSPTRQRIAMITPLTWLLLAALLPNHKRTQAQR